MVRREPALIWEGVLNSSSPRRRELASIVFLLPGLIRLGGRQAGSVGSEAESTSRDRHPDACQHLLDRTKPIDRYGPRRLVDLCGGEQQRVRLARREWTDERQVVVPLRVV